MTRIVIPLFSYACENDRRTGHGGEREGGGGETRETRQKRLLDKLSSRSARSATRRNSTARPPDVIAIPVYPRSIDCKSRLGEPRDRMSVAHSLVYRVSISPGFADSLQGNPMFERETFVTNAL